MFRFALLSQLYLNQFASIAATPLCFPEQLVSYLENAGGVAQNSHSGVP